MTDGDYANLSEWFNSSDLANNSDNGSFDRIFNRSPRLIATIGYGTLFIAGTVTILPVLCLIILVRDLRSVNSAIVINILLSGLVLIEGYLPFLVVTHILSRWVFGEIVCRLVGTCDAVGKIAIIIFITLASLERFMLIVRNKKFPPKLITPLCIAGWIAAMASSLPIFLYSKLSKSGHRCSLQFPTVEFRENFMYFCFGALFLLPTALITVFYVGIITKFKSSRRNLARFSASAESNTRSSKHGKLELDDSTSRDRQESGFLELRDRFSKRLSRSFLRHRKPQRTTSFQKMSASVTRMVLGLISCFMISWVPYWILNFITVVYPYLLRPITSSGSLWLTLLNIIHMLPYLGACVNPILYILLTNKFRDSMKSWKTKRQPSSILSLPARRSRDSSRKSFKSSLQRRTLLSEPNHYAVIHTLL